MGKENLFLQVNAPMCTYFVCLAGLLAALILVEPVSCEEIEKTGAPAQALCPFVRSAADQTDREEEARARLQEAEKLSTQESDVQSSIPLETPSPVGSPILRADRILFESFLVNWLFLEDLAPEQRELLQTFFSRCGVAADRLSLAASIFGQLNTSQRATFVGITHALMHTWLTDRQNGERWGDALGLIQELIDIQGENNALSSDHQFQMIVRLAPDAPQKLERAAHFLKGENHIFHKDYPISFRQFRRIGLRGQEAGLHFCLTRDGRFAQIHIDYRFGLLHLGPANSDVRAEGNHQRHAERWPEFTLAERPIRVRRVVLRRQNLDLSLNSLTRE
jgi:hypothetical protein